jgi:hypothetical protein
VSRVQEAIVASVNAAGTGERTGATVDRQSVVQSAIWSCYRCLGKAWESVREGEAEIVVCLVPARVDMAWWHDYCAQGDVRFLRGRVRFGGAESGAPLPSAVVVFRNAQERYETETETERDGPL